MGDLVIRVVRIHIFLEVIIFQEDIKDISAQDHQVRNDDLNLRICLEYLT